jgi:AcrR family transcriptional regulator
MSQFQSDDDLIINDQKPARADARRNHALLLRTARTLFNEQGVDAVSMTQIAESAGVGKGTLYRNFENKIDLCYALLDQEQREMQETTLRRLRAGGTTPGDDLRWFTEQAADFVLRNLDLLYAGQAGATAVTLELPAHLWWRQTIRNLLNRLDVCESLDYMSDTLYIMLHPNTLHFQRLRLGYSRQQIFTGLSDLISKLMV